LISEAYLKSENIQEAYEALLTAAQVEPEAEESYLGLQRG
jgi:cytochrome c-type biogenesis protein CcmH/NrfG